MSGTSPPAFPRERSRTSRRSRARRNQPPSRPRPGVRGRSPARRALPAAGTATLTATLTAALAAALTAGLATAPARAAPTRPAATVTSPDATEPPPVPIATRINTGTPDQDGYSIAVRIGGQSFPAPALTGSCGVGIWVLTVTRTPTVDAAGTPDWDPQNSVFPMCTAANASTLGAAISKLGDDRLVIINDIESAGNRLQVRLPQLAAALAPLGVTNEAGAVLMPIFALSAVGIHGLSYGQAWQRAEILPGFTAPPAPPAASINASLVPDVNGRYVLTSYGYVVYNDDATAAGQPGISVGGHFYPQPRPLPPNPLSPSGFQVLVVNRQTLAEISNTSYCLQDCNGLQSMTAALDQVGGNEGLMAFIRSYGPDPAPAALFGSDPASAALIPQVAAFAGAIRAVGGTPQALFGLAAKASPAFHLVGAASPPATTLLPPYVAPEAASTIPGQGSQPDLTGVLAPGNRGMWYGPVSDATLPGIDLEIYNQLATITQPPTPWPVPAPGNTAQADALQTISNQLCKPAGCGGNVRSTYGPATDPGVFGLYYSDLDTDTTSNGTDLCAGTGPLTAYLTVTCQLKTEAKDEQHTHDAEDIIFQVLTAEQALATTNLGDVYTEVNKAVHVGENSKVTAILGQVITGLLDIGGKLAPGAGAAFGMASGVLKAGLALAANASGEAQDALTTTVGQLAKQTAAGFLALSNTLQRDFGYIDTDWGRLDAIGGQLTVVDKNALLAQLDRQAKLAFYQSLITVAYQVLSINHLPDPCNEQPLSNRPAKTCNWSYSFGPESLLALREPVPGPAQYQVTIIGKDIIDSGNLAYSDAFPAFLMTDVTRLGAYPPDVFLHWPFQRSPCDGPYLIENGSCTATG